MNTTNKDTKGYDVEEISLRKITIIVLIAIVLICIFFVISREYFITTTEDLVYEMVLKPQSEKLIETRAYEKEQLSAFLPLEDVPGSYQIPIENAKEILVREYKNKPWASK